MALKKAEGMETATILASKILIVDDEEANVMLLAHMLEEEGYANVMSTTDPRRVVDMHREHLFDMILLDMRMPHMAGDAVMEALKPEIRDDWIPVIVLTAQTDARTREVALKAGARDFLQKPLRQWEVLLRIYNLLEVRHLYRAQHGRAKELEELVRQRTKKISDANVCLIECLGRAGEFRDNETGAHIVRVSKSCEMLALAVGLSAEQAELIRLASPMHDVGKIGIPDAILMKPAELDTAERDIMERHTTFGSEIIGEHGSEVLSMARTVALSHHEKWDGSGYPSGLKENDIPLEARIVAVCDVFDALMSVRPYKEAWSAQDALVYLQDHSGKQFDPQIVQAFCRIFPDVVAIRQQIPD